MTHSQIENSLVHTRTRHKWNKIFILKVSYVSHSSICITKDKIFDKLKCFQNKITISKDISLNHTISSCNATKCFIPNNDHPKVAWSRLQNTSPYLEAKRNTIFINNTTTYYVRFILNIMESTKTNNSSKFRHRWVLALHSIKWRKSYSH